MISYPNLKWIRTLRLPDFAEFGPRLYQTLKASERGQNQIEQQVNGNLSGQPQPPPRLSGMNVTAQNGIFHVSLFHNADFYRGVRYHVEYATDPNFGTPFPLPMHDAREWRGSLGNLTLYFRSTTSYGTSAPAPWVYHGGSKPIAVTGGGISGPPLPSISQGSGTGFPQQGLQGSGQQPFRGASPPQRVSL